MNYREFDDGTRAIAQAEAARILATLTKMQIDKKLPIATWRLSAFLPEVQGQVTVFERDETGEYVRNDKESIANVRAWAAVFNVSAIYAKWETDPENGEMYITLTGDGITVKIWASVTSDAISR